MSSKKAVLLRLILFILAALSVSEAALGQLRGSETNRGDAFGLRYRSKSPGARNETSGIGRGATVSNDFRERQSPTTSPPSESASPAALTTPFNTTATTAPHAKVTTTVTLRSQGESGSPSRSQSPASRGPAMAETLRVAKGTLDGALKRLQDQTLKLKDQELELRGQEEEMKSLREHSQALNEQVSTLQQQLTSKDVLIESLQGANAQLTAELNAMEQQKEKSNEAADSAESLKESLRMMVSSRFAELQAFVREHSPLRRNDRIQPASSSDAATSPSSTPLTLAMPEHGSELDTIDEIMQMTMHYELEIQRFKFENTALRKKLAQEELWTEEYKRKERQLRKELTDLQIVQYELSIKYKRALTTLHSHGDNGHMTLHGVTEGAEESPLDERLEAALQMNLEVDTAAVDKECTHSQVANDTVDSTPNLLAMSTNLHIQAQTQCDDEGQNFSPEEDNQWVGVTSSHQSTTGETTPLPSSTEPSTGDQAEANS